METWTYNECCTKWQIPSTPQASVYHPPRWLHSSSLCLLHAKLRPSEPSGFSKSTTSVFALAPASLPLFVFLPQPLLSSSLFPSSLGSSLSSASVSFSLLTWPSVWLSPAFHLTLCQRTCLCPPVAHSTLRSTRKPFTCFSTTSVNRKPHEV